MLLPFVVEEQDETGAIVREARDGVGEAREEFFERAPVARRGGESGQRFELADGRAQTLFGRANFCGVEFGQGHGFLSKGRRLTLAASSVGSLFFCGSARKRFSRGGLTEFLRRKRGRS